jgi:hypothetical protein
MEDFQEALGGPAFPGGPGGPWGPAGLLHPPDLRSLNARITTGRKKRTNGPPPQPTLPTVRHAILELFARLPPQRCPHCRKWICSEQRRE